VSAALRADGYGREAVTPAELRERAEAASLPWDGSDESDEIADYIAVSPRLIAALCRVVEAADGLRAYGTEFDDARISYKSVQVARVDESDYDAARQALGALLREVDRG
jgi:hypothetical protein